MSMAARAISSRAVSSTSLAGITSLALPAASLLVSPQLVLDGVHQGLPGGLDDVVGDAHCPPRLVPVAGGDQHACLGAGPLGLVEDAHLVVEKRHLLEVGIEFLERLPERVIQRVDGAVSGGGGVLGNALDPEANRRLGHRLLVAVVLLDDDAVAVE